MLIPSGWLGTRHYQTHDQRFLGIPPERFPPKISTPVGIIFVSLSSILYCQAFNSYPPFKSDSNMVDFEILKRREKKKKNFLL